MLMTSGCVVEFQTCKREVARLNLGLGHVAPRSAQPSIPPGSVNEYQLRLGVQRQLWLIPIADETQGMQVKLCYPLPMRAIPERLRSFMYNHDTKTTLPLLLPLPIDDEVHSQSDCTHCMNGNVMR